MVEADITDPELAEQAVVETLDRFTRLDILVNNACIMLLGTALHTRVAEWDPARPSCWTLLLTHAALD